MTSVLTNTAAMAAMQTLRSINSSMEKAQSEVSSGLRVSTAADNAAYWSISTTMQSDGAAVAATIDALGFSAAKTDVAYTGIDATLDVLSEFKAKLVAAKEPGVDTAKIQSELDQFKEQVVGISTSASFNGINWLSTDLADINDSDLNKVSMISSFVRSSSGVSVGTMDFSLSEVALFNENGGGILQADTRKSKTLGGIRNYDTFMDMLGDIHMDLTNTGQGYRAVHDFTFGGPLAFGASDVISFDVTVDADNPADLPPPYHPGKTTTNVVIDRNLVDSLFPAAGGVVSSYTQYAELLDRALTVANTGALATTYVDYNGYPIIDRIGVQTRENSGLDGSSVEIANFYSDVGSGGLSDVLTYGSRGSKMTLLFDPFEVHRDGDDEDGVRIGFKFSVNGAPPKAYEFDRTYVNQLLGKTNGKVETETEMVVLLQSLIGADWPDVIFQDMGAGSISVRSDEGVDRLSGGRTSIGFTNILVSIEPLAEQNFVDIDIVANPHMLDTYIEYMELVTGKITDAGAMLGALRSRIDMQTDFAESYVDTIEKGVGRLVDADMNDVSTRLRALETQQQLAVQALNIANTDAANIMRLFE